MNKPSILILTIIISLYCAVVYAQKPAKTVDTSIIYEAGHSIKRGIDYLHSTSQDDGSWDHYPATTALIVTAMLRSPDDIVQSGNPDIEKGLKFILGFVKPDGGIYTNDPMKAYNTAICLMALVEAGKPEYNEIISNARKYLLSQQADEHAGYSVSDSLYGGIGYGDDDRPDLSNLQMALEALAASESYEKVAEADMKGQEGRNPVTGNKPHYEKAIVFLTRAQNLKSTNPYSFALNDGGFMYYPGLSKAGGVRSYGSMTYAGLKSFIYANVDKNDERIKAAYMWISKNYTVKENPGIGSDGLFYNYHTMSKALNVYGTDYIVTPDGKKNNWREDLIRQLATIQFQDGSWVNENARWWESNKDLVTAYSILSLINAGWPEQ
jgi:squalene-hopene/tetraprenyl-beta-curcumene cyclase